MNIGPASDAQFGDVEAFLDFLGQNEAAHLAFASRLAALGITISVIPPVGNPMESPEWLNDHWQRHREECLHLDISVPDLSVVDLSDEEQYVDWMLLHAQLHEQQNKALGITS